MKLTELRIVSAATDSSVKWHLSLLPLLAGALSSALHVEIWQAYQQLATQVQTVIATKALQFELVQTPPPPKITAPEPKPIETPKPPSRPIEPVVPKPIPKVKPVPIKKPAPVIAKSEPVKASPPPIVKPVENPGGGGGYGLASATAKSTGTGVGSTGGVGSGSGGGVGTGTGTGTGSGTAKDDVDAKGFSTPVVVLERVAPVYPRQAQRRGIEGRVTIQFVIRTDGSVANPVVVQAEPSDVFNDAALEAIEQWKFKQKIVNGVAVEQRTVQTLSFKLTNRDTDE